MAELHAAQPAEPSPPPGDDAPAADRPEGATLEVHGAAAEDEHHDDAYIPSEVYLLIALVVLIVAAWRPAKRAILGALDARAEKIRADLDEAKRLREEAQATLASLQRKQRDAISEAQEIIAHAQRDAERLRDKAMKEIEESIKRREALAADRIAQAEAAALAEVRNTAVDVAIAASRQLIASKLDPGKARALIDSAIDELPKKLH